MDLTTLNIPSIVGWVANVFFLWGVYALGKKNIAGFYVNTLGNVLYFIQSILLVNHALLFLSVGLTVLNIMGIMNWKKQTKVEKPLVLDKKEKELLLQIEGLLRHISYFIHEKHVDFIEEFKALCNRHCIKGKKGTWKTD